MELSEQKQVIDFALDSLADLRDQLLTAEKTASEHVAPDVDPRKVLDFIKGVQIWG